MIMRNRNIACIILALIVASTGFGWAQSEGGGLLNKLFESKDQIKEEDKAKIEAEAKKLLEGETEEDVIKKAEDALASDPDKLLELGRKLLEDPDAMKKGEALANEQGVSSDALEQARQMMDSGEFANLLKSAAEEAKKDGTLKDSDLGRQIEGLSSNDLQGLANMGSSPSSEPAQPMPLPTGVIPAPKDPVKTPIPRPNLADDQKTTIKSEEARFNAETNEVMFQGNVNLRHPQFDLNCDILEVQLAGEGAKVGGMGGQVNATEIQRAIAKGYVQIERMSLDGKVQVAKSRLATYEGDSGDVVLSDYPVLQSGKDLIRGLSETTKIYLRSNGQYHVEGKAEYIMASSGNALQFKPRP